jgi:O-antigen/teichoic acid export membrane protein
MQLKFLSNLILMVFLNLLVKPIAIFGIDAAVQNKVGVEEYGFYFSLLNFTYIFNIILDFGITNYNTKYVAQYPNLVKRYMGKTFPLRLVLFVVYVVFSALLAWTFGYEGRQWYFLAILIFNQFLISITFYFRSYFAGLLMFKIDILLSVLDKLLLILIAGWLLYGPMQSEPFQLEWFVWSQTASFGITVCVALVLIIWKVGIPRLHWSPVFNWVMLRKSFPYALLVLLMMLYQRVDAVMIERLIPGAAGKHEAGIYAQAFRILDAFVMFGMLFSNLLYPMFSRLIKQNESVRELLNSASRLLIGFSIVGAAFCFFYGATILDLIYTEIPGAVPTFQWLLLSLVPISVISLFGTLLTANGSLRILNYLSFAGLLVNVGLNLFFIPRWGAFGASLATVLTQSGIAVLQLIYVWKFFRLQLQISVLLRYVGLIAWLTGTFYGTRFLGNEAQSAIVFMVSSCVGAFVFGMIQWRMLLSMVRKKA